MQETTGKPDNKVQPKRHMFRFTFHSEEHKDIIRMLQTCPKTKQYQLIVDAMRFFDANYLQDLKVHAIPEPSLPLPVPTFNKTEGDAMSKLNISDMFS